MNNISKNSLFLPEGVKIDFENTQPPFDAKAVKWKKTIGVRNQVFLAVEIPAT
jgi:hypothetical protein